MLICLYVCYIARLMSNLKTVVEVKARKKLITLNHLPCLRCYKLGLINAIVCLLTSYVLGANNVR